MSRNILLILFALSLGLSLPLASKPLSPNQKQALSSRLKSANPDEKVKLRLLLIQDALENKQVKDELKARRGLENLIAKNPDHRQLRQTNLYQIGALYYQQGKYRDAFDQFETLFKSLDNSQTAYRNLTLQSLVKASEKRNRLLTQEKYLSLYVVGLSKASPFFKTSGGFTQLIALGIKNKSKKAHDYYRKWLESALKQGKPADQQRVLTAWANHAATKGNYRPEPFEKYIAFLAEQKQDIRPALMLHAQSAPKNGHKIGIYEQVLTLDKKEEKQPDLGMLTTLFSAYEKEKSELKQIEILKLLAYRADYKGRKGALRRLASLSLKNKDWLPALTAHQELLKLEPLDSSKEAVIYQDNAIFAAGQLQKEDLQLQLLSSKAASPSQHIKDPARLAAYGQAMVILRNRKDILESEKLYQATLLAPFQAKPNQAEDQIHLIAALNREAAGKNPEALSAFQTSFELAQKKKRPDPKTNAALAGKILTLTQLTGGEDLPARKQYLAQLELARDEKGQASQSFYLGQHMEQTKNKKEALSYYQRSLGHYKKVKDQEKTNQLLTLIANLQEGGGEAKLKSLLELESKQMKNEDKTPAIVTRIEIAHLYQRLGEPNKALGYYRQAYRDNRLPKTKDSPWAAYYAGSSLNRLARYPEAIEAFDEGLVLALPPVEKDEKKKKKKKKKVKIKDPEVASRLYLGKGRALGKQGHFDQGTQEIDKALALKVKKERPSLVSAKSSILINAGKNQAAENLLKAEVKKTKKPKDKLQALVLLARAQVALNLSGPALKTLAQAAKLKGEEVDAQGAQIQTLTAFAQNQAGSVDAAIATLQALIPKLQQAEDKGPLPGAYLQLVGYLINAGQLAEAETANQQAKPWVKGQAELENRVMLNDGKIAIKQEKYKDALTHFDEMSLNPASPKDLVAEYHYQRGYARLQISRFDPARKDFVKAQRTYEEIGRNAEAGQAQMAQANVLLQLGKMTEAEAAYQDLLSKAGKESRGDVQNALAFLYSEMGKYEKALKASSQAEKSYGKADQKKRTPEVLNARGLIFLKMNDFAQAEITFKKALKVNKPFKNTLLDAEIVNNLGGLYRSKGDLNRAREELLKAAELQKQLGFESQLALTYNNIGSVYLEQGKEAEALDFLGKSRTFSEKYGLKKELATSWNNEGILYFKKEKFAEAESAFREAVALQRELELRLDLARTLNNLSIIESRKDKPENALDLVQQAVAALAVRPLGGGFFPNPPADGLLAPDMMKGFLMNKGGFLKELAAKNDGKRKNYLNAAYQTFALSIELIESIRSQIKGEESQQMLMQANIDIYQQLISILYDLGIEDPQGKFHEKAYYYAEMSRARSFLDRLQEQTAKAAANLPPEIRNREDDLKNQVATLDQKIFIELKKTKEERNERLIEDWQTQKTGLQLQHKALVAEMEKRFPEFAALKYPKVYGVSETQQKLLGKTAQLLLYFLGEDRSYGFIVSKKGLKMVALAPNGDIDALIRKYRTTLKDPLIHEDPEDEEMVIDSSQSHVVTGLQIYRTVLEPLLKEGDPDATDLILIPDGVLYYLPFETVVVEIHPQDSSDFAKGREYLIHRYSTNYSPSASVLGTLKDQVARRDPNKMQRRMNFVGFGDPQYGPTRAQRDSFVYNPTLQEQGFYELSRLVNTIKELKAISSVFPGSQKVFLRDKTVESVVKKNLKGYRYIHFATHGILDERNPEFSGVVMNLVKSKKPEDGFLQASEIFDLKIDPDLVVLSACETGLGKVIKGEGMVGLTRAFLFAGSPSIVVSLWTVADTSTSKLMIYFYRYLAKGLTKDAALRKAKLQLMTETEDEEYLYHDPFYWGPFILNGTRT